MADTQIPYVAPDGSAAIEAAAQLLGRILFDLGDARLTLIQALLDRPTQADVARALADLQIAGVDLTAIRQAVEAAVSAAGQAQATAADKASRGSNAGPDADWTIPATAVHVAIPALTASRTWSLPDVDDYPHGQDLVVSDEGRVTGPGLTLALVPLAGSGDSIPPYADNRILFDGSVAVVRLRRGVFSNVWVLC